LGIPLLFTEESEVSNHDRGKRPKRCMGRTESPNLKTITSEPGLDTALFFNESEMALFSEPTP
jgi:hypothetical protein